MRYLIVEILAGRSIKYVAADGDAKDELLNTIARRCGYTSFDAITDRQVRDELAHVERIGSIEQIAERMVDGWLDACANDSVDKSEASLREYVIGTASNDHDPAHYVNQKRLIDAAVELAEFVD
ncbi:hypothetical protein Rpal_3789 [Rhodopseudomonas palustris TIE-1]|uniref:hypothetical protein n=1 Tax=Rhodopseudomonas palustris TaxID=1076 RepID=UPI000164B344|nr:hypothetical protein [Rhodopseudomonas palustris]ACF02288.1 hypothetical protein Rpal_3789 [Rhodopseudomonas palustris TIE-1]